MALNRRWTRDGSGSAGDERAEVPEDNADGYRDVEGMFGAELRNLYGQVRSIHHILGDSRHLIAEDKSVFRPRLRTEILEHHGIFGLFDAYYGIALRPQTGDRLARVLKMLPSHAVLRPEGRLVYLGRRRHGTDAAQENPVCLERIGTAECRSDIVCTSDIVQNYHYAGIRQGPVFFLADPPEFDVKKLAVVHRMYFFTKVFNTKVVKIKNRVTFVSDLKRTTK